MTEIEKLLTINYEDVCNYLKNKYGYLKKDYFSDKTMTKKTQGITRGKEGLSNIDSKEIIKIGFYEN